MDLHQHHQAEPGRGEAERLLGIAEKLLQTRDLTGSREFALLAQETEPLLEGSDQILAITDVLLAAERRVVNNRHHDWYAILQTSRHSLYSDPDLLKKNYRRLALLLHPDKNRFPLADSAFKLVADAWAVLSDASRRGLYDHELNVYEKVEFRHQPPPPPPHPQGASDKDKLPVRKSPRGGFNTGGGEGGGMDTTDPSSTPVGSRPVNRSRPKSGRAGWGGGAPRTEAETKFWTACPYCYVLYEYPRGYEDCCLRCQNCERAYHATAISSLPPMVPGKEAYYCCWGFFPLGFSLETTTEGKNKVGADNDGIFNVNVNANDNNNNNGHNPNSVFPNWMPAGMFTTPVAAAAVPQGGGANLNVNMNMNVGGGFDISDGGATFRSTPVGISPPGTKRRGRPRKNP